MISETEIRQIFSNLEHGSGDGFFQHVADDVDWTVMGTHPLAGRYNTKHSFQQATFARLNKLLPGGTQLEVTSVIVAGDTAAIELQSKATAINGMRFDNRYCWLVRFADHKIVEVRAYLDSALVAKLIAENEGQAS